MLRLVSRLRFCVAQRNFFVVPPLYPEKEDLAYRPKITSYDDSQKQLHAVYKKKLAKIKSRVTQRVREMQPKEEDKQESYQKNGQDLIQNVLKHVYIDEETNCPLGLFFDDFVYDIKLKRGQQYEAEYNRKVQGLLSQMRVMSETELLRTSQDLLVKSEAPEYIAKARKVVFDRFLEGIKKLPEEERKKILGDDAQDFDKKINDEAILNKYVDTNSVKAVAEEMARENLQKDLEDFQIYDPKYNDKNQQLTFGKAYLKDLDFYESGCTVEEISDDERLLKMRYIRPSDGQEALQTEQSIIDKVNLNFVKRAYLKRLANKQQDPKESKKQINAKDQQNWEFKQIHKYLKNLDTQSLQLQMKAKKINQRIVDPVKLQDIVDNIDFLLLGAPKFIKDLYNDPKNKIKGYESVFQDVEKNKGQSLFWKDFGSSFQTIFPKVKLNKQQDTFVDIKKQPYNRHVKEFFEEKVDEVKKDEYQFSVELYKEFQQPSNLEFFHHYLTNIFKLNREQINDGLQAFSDNINPYTYEVPSTAMMADDVDPDFEDVVEEEVKIEDFKEKSAIQIDQLIEKDYSESSLLYYVGRGRRKSSICYVQLKKGVGEVTVNGKNLINYFTHPIYRRTALRVLELAHLSCLVDVNVVIRGGSQSAQSQCICSALSRAIVKMCPSIKKIFRKLLLTRTDSRQVERKKLGLYKARKKYPYSRR
ncbi:unnamed protein product (macronuclear) [Paramecium tetraurelia]|uniref:Ribosomal protein S9 n=1 Tax=Paramecium tetraurelia TaxID=5888 RepID=A0DAX2_PARTE|nr:uncharacterized protein GSPATT00015096001 [Paramecium tetraurelia]CAK80189.1 unnamed protein product [Paramecium tetraurelia]|eukprot:XP_001447586.1 hypothetical protein (macronuclear) [Paramecium tetraurelia strain d4-2]